MEIYEALSAVELALLSRTADEIWHEYFPALLEPEQIDYMVDKFLSVPALTDGLADGYEYYLAEEDGRICGFTALRPEDGRLFLSKIYLYKDWRGKGLSKDLFAFIQKRAAELGLSKIYLTVNKHNAGPIAVYEKQGFEKTDAVVTDIGGGFVMDDYIMEKTLK